MAEEGNERQSNQRDWTQKYLDVARVILLGVRPDQTIALVNRRGCEVLEGTEEEIVGKNWFDTFLPEEPREEVREMFLKICRGEAELPEYYENPVITNSGNEKLIAWHNTLLVEPDGRIVGTLSSGEDITDRYHAEQALRRSEAELRAIVDTAVDGIITIDDRGKVRSFNSAATKLFGYRPEEIIGKSVNILMPEPDRSDHDQYIHNYMGTGKARVIGIGRDVLGRRKDGTTFPIYLAISEMQIEKQRLFTGIIHDLTDIKKMQQKVLEAENLAAIGEMAATVAHEIKNPLAGISGAIQVLRDTLDTDDPRHGVMGEILAQVQRLDDTVRQLLMLSKPWKPSKQICDLRHLTEQITSFAQDQKSFTNIQFLFDGEESLSAPVDPSLFQQVIWNLLDNSAQAMGKTGEIYFLFSRDQRMASIEIEDTGAGIPAELRSRIFQPFVTSKTHGTGLGLPICKKILESHDGSIQIGTPLGGGTRVVLKFPRKDSVE
jgi:two-component system sensor kinase FixL